MTNYITIKNVKTFERKIQTIEFINPPSYEEAWKDTMETAIEYLKLHDKYWIIEKIESYNI